MASEYSYAYKAFIKNIYLFLPKYTFDHHPIEGNDGEIFLGRNKITERLLNMLKNGDERGAYLVTGYRGMGKTSFVRKVIKDYKKFKDENNVKVKESHISFAQNDLKEIDVLRQITKFIKDELQGNDRLKIINYLERRSLIFFFGCLSFFLLLLFGKYFQINIEIAEEHSIINALVVSLIGGLGMFQILQLLLYIARNYSSVYKLVTIYRQVELLYDRCQGEVNDEKGIQSTNEQLPIGFINKKSKKFQPLTSKEAEYELIEILSKYKKLFFYDRSRMLGKIFVLVFFIVINFSILFFLYVLYCVARDEAVFCVFFVLIFMFFIAFNREVFVDLVNILREFRYTKEFIFVFDELDKLDPQTGKGYFYEKNIAASTNLHYSTYTNELRERKYAVLNLLSSMKYFVTEAKARFIFIAGREMFDASLADIADRQSSISSVFHQIIYVDSFYRDKPSRSRASGIGEMVEEYLEKILIDEKYKKDKKDEFYKNHFLANYYEFLNEKYGKKINESVSHEPSGCDSGMIKEDEVGGEENCLSKEEILKIIFTLQNLIIYIAYRSNGSPKKMVHLLEESIVRVPKNEIIDRRLNIYAGSPMYDKDNTMGELYLRISYKKQYKLGFTSYLFRPFLLMYGSFLKRYGDSLLVSSPYLIDNLIKFHPFAFSIKNLELLPEIISSNKTPELRLFIEELIYFLSQNHIRETESGFFEYKFYDKTHNEIAYISKIAEEESAAFNFTLDENYPIKKHLAARIKELRETHKDFKDSNDEFSMSLTFLNNLLGDAELYDDEFEDAIISYSDALQGLPKKEVKYFTHEQLILSVRFRLKLGLTYEKMKSYDVALGHYTDALLQMKSFFEANGEERLLLVSPSFRELLLLSSNALASVVYVQEKLDEGLTFQKMANFSKIFHDMLNNVGKTSYNGRDIIESNHYAQMATIAFYKNMPLPYNEMEVNVEFLNMIFFEQPLKEHSFIQKSFEEINKNNKYNKMIFNIGSLTRDGSRDFRFSFISYVYYKKCLASYLPNNKQLGCLHGIVKNSFDMIYDFNNSHDKNMLRGVADALTRLGDLLLTLFDLKIVEDEKKKILSNEFLKSIIEIKNDDKESVIGNLDKGFKSYIDNNKSFLFGETNENEGVLLEGIVLMYYLSGRFYLKSGRSNSTSFQFRKILLLMRNFLYFDDSSEKLIFWLENSFLKKILEISSWNNNSSDRPQILKFKDYFDINSVLTPKEYSKYIYMNLSNNPETKEALLLIADMKIKASDYSVYTTLEDFITRCPEQSLVTPFNGISHQFVRIVELNLQVSMNYKYLKEKLNKEYIDINKRTTPNLISWEKEYSSLFLINDNNIDKLEIREYEFTKRFSDKYLSKKLGIVDENDICLGQMKVLLKEYFQVVVNSIYCNYHIIASLKIYGVNHFLNNAYMASFHEKLAFWLKHLRLCKILDAELELDFEIDSIFNQLLGFRVIHTLEVVPQYQLALQYYYQSLQVHSEGSAYKYQISNFIYLEDDYNDNLYHFGAALERQRINSGYIRKRIKEIENETKDAGILKYDMFVNSEKINNR
ncbi:ATP-binding protein [Runella sp. MFBS21]|uniref:ATP-binding protein n=1 Tax=Runella sp. MFBS21 TaxID=3034018 RepID=UPI0023F7C138|nr:ATP-binding protein [Runella sp. MFBS21]MDF7821592.1 ATP-binding protein [Runella sp. MFBS21]